MSSRTILALRPASRSARSVMPTRRARCSFHQELPMRHLKLRQRIGML
jgi:hypothetical protein